MEIKSILASHAIRFIAETGPVFEPRSPVPLINEMRERYGFVQVPQTVADLDFKKGVSFLRGYYKGKIITKLEIYENGLLCEANESTNLTDDLLSEILAWAVQKHGLPVKETGVRAYISQMEVEATTDIGALFSKLRPLGSLISNMISNYGQPVAEYQISGLKMHYDSMSTPIPRSPDFTFERRATKVYGENLFFTSAPVMTEDHLKILNEMERLFTQ